MIDQSGDRRVALVTGANRGIGSGIAVRLAREGFAVGVAYRHPTRSSLDVVDQILREGNSAYPLRLDVTDSRAIDKAYEELTAELGHPSVLINNAAVSQEKPYLEITDDDWAKMLTTNLMGSVWLTKKFLPVLIQKKWGRIVNIVSIGGQWGGLNQIHYAVSKSALIGLTQSLAKTFSHTGVTVNAVSPGLIETEMSRDELSRKDGEEKLRLIPSGRIGKVEDVASAVAFLCSEEAGYITGQTLNVNGGMYFG